ncbi:hypothetical protein GS464_18635 [Rhodococcus hoagii]|nr:hypothetical protein [Prescottella equi]
MCDGTALVGPAAAALGAGPGRGDPGLDVGDSALTTDDSGAVPAFVSPAPGGVTPVRPDAASVLAPGGFAHDHRPGAGHCSRAPRPGVSTGTLTPSTNDR